MLEYDWAKLFDDFFAARRQYNATIARADVTIDPLNQALALESGRPDGFFVPARWRDYCICAA
jgi:hypothetical protein